MLATIDPIRKPKLRDLTWPDLDPSTGIQIPRKSALILAQQSITIHKVITGIVTEKMWINECSFKGMTMNGHVRTVCESLMEGGTAFLHLSRRPGDVDKSRIDRAIFIARMKSGTETSVSEELIENEVRP